MSRRFEMIEEGAKKFWEISIEGSQHRVTFGRIGTAGQSKTKTFPSPEDAKKDGEALIRSKVAKGYQEVGGTAAVAAFPTAVKSSKEPRAPKASQSIPAEPTTSAVRTLQRAKASFSDRIGARCALPKGHFLAILIPQGAEIGGTAHVWNASGQEIATFKFPEAAISGWGRTASGEVVFICQDQIYRFDGEGKKTIEQIPGARRVSFLSDGTAVIDFKDDDLKLRHLDGSLTILAKKIDRGYTWPVVLSEGGFAIIATEQPRRLLVFDRTGKPIIDQKLAGNGNSTPIQTPDGRIVVASKSTLHILGPGKKHIKANLGDGIACGPLALANGWVAAAAKNGVVGFYAQDGKLQCSFRRDPLGSGENTIALALLADGSVIAPSLKGTLYRLSQTGELLGAFELGRPPQNPIALDDGTLVVADDKSTLHFIGAADFQETKDAPEGMPDLSKEAEELERHFAPWALTPHCKQILKDLLTRLMEVQREGEDLKLAFLTDEQDICQVCFGPPQEVEGDWPQSYKDVSALHGEICFEDGPPDGIYFGDCNAELTDEESKRFEGLCDAGQNWYVFDHKKKNKLGEPTIVLFDHGAEVSDGDPFPYQNKEAFGVGGMLLRSLAFRVFSKNEDFSNCGWG